MISTCKICNRNNFSEFIYFNNYPKSISFLFNDKGTSLKDKSAITFNQCNICHHIQISTDIPQSFYENYIMTVSHSNKMNDFQNEQATHFINECNLEGKTVLEAGCGDGNFLTILKSKGCIVYGNEPSKSFREIAVKKNLIVDDQFINNSYCNSLAPFDALVSREVMEHVPDPIDFLINLRRLLKKDGSILIEIPNFEKTLREQRYYDLFPDHLSYFTRESLTAAMLLGGYKNIKIHYGMEEEFIYAIAQNNEVTNKGLKLAIQSIQADFDKLFNIYSNIVVWGAGGKGISVLGSLAKSTNIKYVVDSDSYKQNKYLPSSGLLVNSPEHLFNDLNVELLIITNLAYVDEIIQILKINSFSKKIMMLSRDGIIDYKEHQ